MLIVKITIILVTPILIFQIIIKILEVVSYCIITILIIEKEMK